MTPQQIRAYLALAATKNEPDAEAALLAFAVTIPGEDPPLHKLCDLYTFAIEIAGMQTSDALGLPLQEIIIKARTLLGWV